MTLQQLTYIKMTAECGISQKRQKNSLYPSQASAQRSITWKKKWE